MQQPPMPGQVMGDQNMIAPEGAEMPAPAAFDQTQGQGFAGNLGGTTPINAAPSELPGMEGVDYRGLNMPPEGRPARK